MLETIIQAAKNFCQHQIDEPCKEREGATTQKVFISYIDIQKSDSSRYRIYLAAEKALVQKVAQLFLEEDESDDETLQDMTLETTNLIVGSAKVLAEESDDAFTIETPKFEKYATIDFNYDEAVTLEIESADLTLASKELDG
jgi:DNA-binding protein YbaB